MRAFGIFLVCVFAFVALPTIEAVCSPSVLSCTTCVSYTVGETCGWCAPTVPGTSGSCLPGNSTSGPLPGYACNSTDTWNYGTCPCYSYTDCGSCVADIAHCGWCEDASGVGSCKTGTIINPPADCPTFKYGQCIVTGIIAAIVLGSIAGVVILIVLICCCCWCKRRKDRQLEQAALLDERAEYEYYKPKPVEEVAPRSTATRRELEAKYGRSFGGSGR